MKNQIVFLTLATAGAYAFAAVNLPKEGSYDAVSCWTGTATDIAVGKDHSAGSYEMVGTIITNPPGGLGDQNTFRCVGLRTMFKGKAGQPRAQGRQRTARLIHRFADRGRDLDLRLQHLALNLVGKGRLCLLDERRRDLAHDSPAAGIRQEILLLDSEAASFLHGVILVGQVASGRSF